MFIEHFLYSKIFQIDQSTHQIIVTDDEILRAVNQINPLKAPISDGLKAIFYKIVAFRNIYQMVRSFLNDLSLK